MNFRVLQANQGDALLISWEYEGHVRNLLIDGGTAATYKSGRQKRDLYKVLESIKTRGEQIDLLILSHVDDDHVCGVLAGFKDDGLLAQLTKKVWFNSGASIAKAFNQPIEEKHFMPCGSVKLGNVSDNLTSIRRGVSFEKIVKDLKIWDEQLVEAGSQLAFEGAKITILSPTRVKLKKLLKEWKKKAPESLTAGGKTDYGVSFSELLAEDPFDPDSSPTNGGSIALLFEYKGKRLLLLSDAHDETIVDSIKKLRDGNDTPYSAKNRLSVDYVKLAHHGSHRNTSSDFLKLITCQDFIVSTIGGIGHGHPNKRTLARIAKRHPNSNIWFNYRNICDCITRKLSTEDVEEIKCKFKCSHEGFQL